MTNFKYLQKLFFLLVMGFSLSLVCACGDDEEDELVQNPNEGITNPMDSIPSQDEPIVPNDSVSDGGTIVVNGHEAVDLGLSVKWATCNVGANAPEDYGEYFAWGETTTNSDYSWENYKWCDGTDSSMTKYCTISEYGTVDNKIVLDLEDDVAHVKWGGSWRMPTLDDIHELVKKCTKEWTNLNGVNGLLVTGPNGNSIFLPAAGTRMGDLWCIGPRSYGEYWSARLSKNYSNEAFGFSFYEDDSFGYYWYPRYWGRTVRPVTD